MVRPPQDAEVQANADGAVPEVDGIRGITGRPEPSGQFQRAPFLGGNHTVDDERRGRAEDDDAVHQLHAERVRLAARMEEHDTAGGPNDAEGDGGPTPIRIAATHEAGDADAEEKLQDQRACEGRGERAGVEGIVGLDGFGPSDDRDPREERHGCDAARQQQEKRECGVEAEFVVHRPGGRDVGVRNRIGRERQPREPRRSGEGSQNGVR